MADKSEHESRVAMARARHPATRQALEATQTAKQGHTWPKPLACFTESCDARIHFVAEIPRTETKKGRAAYFARNPPKGGIRNEHSTNCLYNLSQMIEVLKDESDGALAYSGRGRDPQTDELVPLYRLPWPHTFDDTPEKVQGDSWQAPGATFTEKYTKLLNTAAKIAELLERYRANGDHPEIIFQAICRGHNVDWVNFLYTPQRTYVLIRRLRDHGELTHPVAVIFRPLRIKNSKRAEGQWAMAEVSNLDDEDPELLFVQGNQRAMDEAFRARAGSVSARMFIGYGMWKTVSYKHEQPKRLTLKLVDDSVIAELPEDIDREIMRRWSTQRPLPE